MNIILAGSPQITIDAFKEIIKNFNVVAIITQTDKPFGRGMKLKETPVSELAKKFNIKTFKPSKIIDIYDELKNIDFDIFLSFAFGQFIPTKILKLANKLSLNIHGSILPKYRGASPIHHAILNNDKEIGITLMEMIKEMDAGNIYMIAKKEISRNTTTGEGMNIISDLAKNNIVNWLKNIDNIIPKEQGEFFTLSPKIKKSFGELTEDLTIYEAERKIKALTPFPSAFIFKNNKRIKILDFSTKPIFGSIEIKCKDGIIYGNKFKKEGKKLVIL